MGSEKKGTRCRDQNPLELCHCYKDVGGQKRTEEFLRPDKPRPGNPFTRSRGQSEDTSGTSTDISSKTEIGRSALALKMQYVEKHPEFKSLRTLINVVKLTSGNSQGAVKFQQHYRRAPITDHRL